MDLGLRYYNRVELLKLAGVLSQSSIKRHFPSVLFLYRCLIRGEIGVEVTMDVMGKWHITDPLVLDLSMIISPAKFYDIIHDKNLPLDKFFGDFQRDKVCSFLYHVFLEDVPLYLGDFDLGLLVAWRLELGK